MTCEIRTLSKIPDLIKVPKLFGLQFDENWLNSVHYSISPTLEIIAFGHGTKLILLGKKYDENEKEDVYSIIWWGELENINNIITSILCLPIVGQSLHTQSTSEWVTIAVGLSSGLVIFYTDSGYQIFSQQWHNETVMSIKAKSGKNVNEEIHISYQSCICILQGNHLFDVLKGMKQSFLKTLNKNFTPQSISVQDTVPCRKWGYNEKSGQISDTVVVGAQTSNGFDHLLSATLEGGFYAKYRSTPPQNSLVLLAGSKPYLGFNYAKEGFVQPVLADVARAVANKIKSSLPSWLGGSQTEENDTSNSPLPPEIMICRFELFDYQRSAMNVYLAPGNELAVVTDNLGRVILIDCVRAIALRVWKGYRDAQCSFIEVTEKNSMNQCKKRDRRHALFIILFAPRRSCLEIWPLQRGSKVAAFNVSKYGQLIYNCYGLLGSFPGSKIKYNTPTCLFMDTSDNTVKEIKIPFHCAINDSNSKIAKDLHILRRIKLCFKSYDNSNEEDVLMEIELLYSNLQTNEIRFMCLEMMAKNQNNKPIYFERAVNTIKKHIEENKKSIDDLKKPKNNENEYYGIQEITSDNLLNVCNNYLKLIEFYNFIMDLAPNNHNEPSSSNPKYEKLNISSLELSNIEKLLDLLNLEKLKTRQNNPLKVTFEETINKSEFVHFLLTFNIQEKESIKLNENKNEYFNSTSELIFKNFFEKSKSLERFVFKANQSTITDKDFMRLLMFYWLSKPFIYTSREDLIRDMTIFHSILQNICLLAGNNVEYDYGAISPWWQNVREMILQSSCALRGLLAAMICRNHAIKCSTKEKILKDSSEDIMNFEELSQETCEWTILIGKLDDIAVLSAILNVSIQEDNVTLPILKYEKQDISLELIVAGGKGIISDLVSKWICNTGINPNKLLEIDQYEYDDVSQIKKYYEKYPLNYYSDEKSIEDEFVEEQDSHINEDENIINRNYIIVNIEILRNHFPFSLQSEVLLVYMTWEYMCNWSKNLSNLNYLSAGIKCLETIKKEKYALKHGLCCMLWNMHLKIPLEQTKKLINKTGRLPKEKLCLQDIGISDLLIPEFLENCLLFLESFKESLEYEKINLNYEEILQDGPIPLTELALQQNIADLSLLELHIELTMVLNLISFFNIKSTKPKYLFDAVSNQALFTEINRKLSYSLPKADFLLQNVRKKFLFKLIEESVDLIREDFNEIFLLDHLKWMEKILSLAIKWDLNIDDLKRYEIVQLFTKEWDGYSHDLLLKLPEKADIGSSLLKVCGKRINYYIKLNPKAWSNIYAIGPQLTNFLDSLNDEDDEKGNSSEDKNFSKKALVELTTAAFKCIPKQNISELKLAGLLLDAACETISEI